MVGLFWNYSKWHGNFFKIHDFNHATLIYITAVTKKNIKLILKIIKNLKLVVGFGEQDYNHASLIFITAVKKY